MNMIDHVVDELKNETESTLSIGTSSPKYIKQSNLHHKKLSGMPKLHVDAVMDGRSKKVPHLSHDTNPIDMNEAMIRADAEEQAIMGNNSSRKKQLSEKGKSQLSHSIVQMPGISKTKHKNKDNRQLRMTT